MTDKPQTKTDKKEKKDKKNRRWYVKIPLFLFKTATALLIAGLLAGVGAGAWFWHQYGDDISHNIAQGFQIAETIDESNFEVLDPTLLVDSEGNTLREFKERNFKYIDLQDDDDLYEKVSNVVVSIEDERFYRHEGFDYYGVGVAVLNKLRGGDLRGASTITQQVVKNIYLTQEQTVSRKIQEAVIAQELENKFSKRQILEYYVNEIYYGNGQYGLETASRYYYGKPVVELTSGELAVLTGIPNNPTIYDPTKQPENALKKRNIILRKMFELEKIDEEEYEIEKNKELNLNVTPSPIDNTVSDYAESYAIDTAVEKLMEKDGFVFQYWFENEEDKVAYREAYNEKRLQMRESLFKGGFRIETSIDREKQAVLQKAIDQGMGVYTRKNQESGLYEKQASAVTIDNRTNEVVAIVGGRTEEGNSFNRAHLGARQPASAIKPFIAYAPAFERGVLPQTIVEDKAIPKGPSNWYSGYWGKMTVRYALEQSVNTIAYQMLIDNGVKTGIQKMKDMEFGYLDKRDENPIISIGGFTYGATPLELTKGLNTFVNQGQFMNPSSLRRISYISTDEVIYDRIEDEKDKEVYTPEASYMTLDVMKDVVDNSTGKRAGFGYEHLAGKTGTSSGRKDQWFIGTTPYYATSIWVGNDQPAKQDIQVSYKPMQIFKQAMGDLHKGLPEIDFKKPNTLTRHSDGAFTVQAGASKKPAVNTKQTNRLKSDRERRESESLALKKRLDDLDYRVVHGLTLREEEARESFAKLRLQSVEQITITGSSDLSKVIEQYNYALDALGEVKRQSVRNDLRSELERIYARKEQDLREIESQIAERERQEQLAIERFEEEERLKRERELNEELDALRQQEDLADLEPEYTDDEEDTVGWEIEEGEANDTNE